jgi:hypothetical protein
MDGESPATQPKKTLVDPATWLLGPSMNYWPLIGSSYPYSNALSSDQQWVAGINSEVFEHGAAATKLAR